MIDKTLDLLKVYLASNQVEPTVLPQLIQDTYRCLVSLEEVPPMGESPSKVDIDATVTDDYIVCLEDGRKLKILKRHLNQTYGLSPEEYRKKWGLPSDYPMVAKNYAAERSRIAKNQGLGVKSEAPRA